MKKNVVRFLVKIYKIMKKIKKEFTNRGILFKNLLVKNLQNYENRIYKISNKLQTYCDSYRVNTKILI